MRLLFLIRSLHLGGAERQFVLLANEMARRRHEVHVAVFYGGGKFEHDLIGLVRLHSLEKHGRWDVLGFVYRWYRLLRMVRPELIYGYLPISNILALVSKVLVPGARIVFGVRSSFLDFSKYDRLAKWEYRLEATFARFADSIVANSESGADWLIARGVPPHLI